MKNLRNIFIVASIIAVMLISSSAFYYLVIFLPHQAEIKSQLQEKEQQKLEEQKVEKEKELKKQQELDARRKIEAQKRIAPSSSKKADTNKAPLDESSINVPVTQPVTIQTQSNLNDKTKTDEAIKEINPWEGIDCYVFGESTRKNYENSLGLTNLALEMNNLEQRKLNEQFTMTEALLYPGWRKKAETQLYQLQQETNRKVDQEIQRCIYLQDKK